MTATVTTVAFVMGLGSWHAGRRVTEVLAERMAPIDHDRGFSANLATALLVVVASRLGLPVSTTQVSAGAIVGAGLEG
jgi:PiT family inorganic phosphate transporter